MSKQHTTPCADCPFSRNVRPGYTGGSAPETYIGQSRGPFLLPCHSKHDYKNDSARRNPDNIQCAGAAIFRANTDVESRLPAALLHLPKDTTKVFATCEEFLSHHRKITMAEAKLALALMPPDELLSLELQRSGVQRVAIKRKD